jgi:putative transposase
MLSPAKRREEVERVRDVLGPDRVSRRRACRVPGQCRATRRRPSHVPDDEPRLVERMVALACEYGRYGYRRVTALLRAEGFKVDHKRVERLWRREGLKVPQEQPKRGRLRLGDGSCVRPRPEREDHVRSYDFVQARTRDGRAFRMLTVIDEFTRECLAIDVARKLKSDDVLERLSDLFVRRGVPGHIRSDNGPEFTAEAVREWLGRVGVTTLFIEPGSPWENGYIESFNGKLSDELLDREVFDTLLEAKVLIERWRCSYNTARPHSSLGYRPPAPEAIVPWTPAFGASLLGPASMAGVVGTLT